MHVSINKLFCITKSDKKGIYKKYTSFDDLKKMLNLVIIYPTINDIITSCPKTMPLKHGNSIIEKILKTSITGGSNIIVAVKEAVFAR
jgi:hypothetical protein